MGAITLRGVTGKSIDLTPTGEWHLSIEESGIAGLVGEEKVSADSAVGLPGEVANGSSIPAMTGDLTITVVADEHRSADLLAADLRRELDFWEPARLMMINPRGQMRSCDVVLNGPLDPPRAFGAQWLEIRAPLKAKAGVWDLTPTVATGAVTVTNIGDTYLWPEIEWKGSPKLTLPSNTQITLPYAASHRRLSLSPWTSHEVTDLDGVIDHALSDLTEMLHLGEGVPRRASRPYSITSGGTIITTCQILDPWK